MFVAPIAIDLTVILACLVALGMILTAKLLAEALVRIIKGLAHGVPLIGGLFAKSATWVEKHIVSALDDAVNGVEGVIGAFWHALGNLMASIGHELVGLAVAVDHFGQYLHSVVRPWVIRTVVGGLQRGVKWLRHELTSTTTKVYRVVKVIDHPEHSAIGGAVRTITRPIKSSLAHLERWTRAQIARLDHALDVTLPHALGGLRSRTGTLERGYSRLWHRLRTIDRRTAWTAVGAAAVAFLAKLGAGWILCRNWRSAGRTVCRMDPTTLESLLAGTLAIVGTISIVDFAKELQAIVGEGESAIHGLIREK